MRGEIESRRVQVGGVGYRIDIDPDPEPTPDEFDCYDQGEARTFRDGAWQFVTVTVTVDLPGVDIGESLGGVEYGDMPAVTIDVDQLIGDHPVPDMIAACRDRLAQLGAQITVGLLLNAGMVGVAWSLPEAHAVHTALMAAHDDGAAPASGVDDGRSGETVLAQRVTCRLLASRLRPLIAAAKAGTR